MYKAKIKHTRTKDGKECQDYAIMLDGRELLTGTRRGTKEEVLKYIGVMVDKLNATAKGKKTARFVINGEYKSSAVQERQ